MSRGWHLPGGGVDRPRPARRRSPRELQEEANVIVEAPAALHGLFFNVHVSRTRPCGGLCRQALSGHRRSGRPIAKFWRPGSSPPTLCPRTRRPQPALASPRFSKGGRGLRFGEARAMRSLRLAARRCQSRPMPDLPLVLEPETPDDADAIMQAERARVRAGPFRAHRLPAARGGGRRFVARASSPGSERRWSAPTR